LKWIIWSVRLILLITVEGVKAETGAIFVIQSIFQSADAVWIGGPGTTAVNDPAL